MDSIRTKLFRTTPYRQLIMFGLPVTILSFIIICSFLLEGSQQYSDLARAFLHGQLNFLKPIGGAGQDPVFYHGKIYWSEGPLPALLLMPFVAILSIFHLLFYQGYIMWLFVLGVFFLVFRLAKVLDYSYEDSLVLAFGFTIGSVFIGVLFTAASWFFAQVITTFLLFWGLYEFFGHKSPRWWLIGLICGLIVMSRATAAPIFLFFLLEFWQTPGLSSRKLPKLMQLCLPVFGVIVLLGIYNFVRFHSILNGGYAHQLLYPSSAESQSYGVFSLFHIPTNLYSAFLRAPEPILRDTTSWSLKFPYIENNIYGMSMFVTSPYLIYLFTQKWSAFDARSRRLLIAIFSSGLLVFSYFGIGLVQFGCRYSLDFLPELFVLFMIMYRKNHVQISRGMKFLLLGSGVVNFYLLLPLIP